ncbi:hypothetical protein JMUB6875_10760 [Nocardia sp. JMUB6875]
MMLANPDVVQPQPIGQHSELHYLFDPLRDGAWRSVHGPRLHIAQRRDPDLYPTHIDDTIDFIVHYQE